MKLPLLSARADFRSICKKLRLIPSYQGHLGTGMWAMTNGDKLGSTEVEQINLLAAGCRDLIAQEVELEQTQERAKSLPAPGILGTRLHMSRSLQGLPTQTKCSFDERREAERSLVDALTKLTGSFAGEYYPLQASCSYPLKPGGMSNEEAKRLREGGLPLGASSEAMEQDWPDARGVFESADAELSVLINRHNHLELMVVVKDGDVQAAMTKLGEAESMLSNALGQAGHSLEPVEKDGYRIRVGLFLPRLVASGDLSKFCTEFGYIITSQTADGFAEVGSEPLFEPLSEPVRMSSELCSKLMVAEKA